MKRNGFRSTIFLVAILGFFVFGIPAIANRIDRARFPWGYVSAGRSTLAGTWVGPLVTRSGQRLAVLIETELAPLDRGRSRTPLLRTRRTSWLEGRALVCTKPGRIQHFTVSGRPDDTDRGTPVRLSFSVADSVPLDGLSASHVYGKWDGKDSIALMVELYLRQGKSAISNTADPDTGPDQSMTLKRSTEAEFNSLCSALPR